ncbi:MAG: hypothetical protein HUK20_01450 [Fibrobacter sp.]|nr:hypothetical protein [Fibrobacter sp.]
MKKILMLFAMAVFLFGCAAPAVKTVTTQVDPITKFIEEQGFFEIDYMEPVTFKNDGTCNVAEFYRQRAGENSGFHGIIDVKMVEKNSNGVVSCRYWGLAVRYKRSSASTKDNMIQREELFHDVPAYHKAPAASVKKEKNCCCAKMNITSACCGDK